MNPRAFGRSLARFAGQILSDAMLALCLAAPFLAGAFFRFALPLAERVASGRFGVAGLVSRFYPLADLFLGFLPGYLMCFAAAMVMLEERDDGTAAYIAVTPVGRGGYLLSRLVVPLAAVAPLTSLVLALFGLSGLPIATVLAVSLASVPVSAAIALFVVSFSGNRVEGLAMGKLGGIILMAMVVPFLVRDPVAYAAGVFPSFWIAAFAIDGRLADLAGFAACVALWLVPLWRKFSRLPL